MVIATPEIKQFSIENPKHSMLIMASDGIWDVLTNKEVAKIIWATLKSEFKEGVGKSATDIQSLIQKAA